MFLCDKHYQRFKKHGDTSDRPNCRVDLSGKKFGKLTVGEYVGDSRWHCECECGNTIDATTDGLKKGFYKTCGQCTNNTYIFKEDYVIGAASNGQEFLFDIEDYNKISKYSWHVDKKDNRVMGKINKQEIFLHRFLLNPTEEQDVDHINGKPEDNRKNNLRICTHLENSFNHKISRNNTSGITGVWFRNDRQKWVAEILYNKKKYTKTCNSLEEAIMQRIDWEFEYFKEFRRGQLDETNEFIKNYINKKYKQNGEIA